VRLVYLIALAMAISGSTVPPSTVFLSNGIRLELQLDRFSARRGDRVRAVVRVTNQSDRVIYRDMVGRFPPAEPDPRCNQIARIVAIEPDTYPDFDRAGLGRRFWRPWEGEYGCPIIASLRPFPPGFDVIEEMVWVVRTDSDTPSVVIRATFEYFPTLDFEQRSDLDVETTLAIVE
jgi:hypothetical protein